MTVEACYKGFVAPYKVRRPRGLTLEVLLLRALLAHPRPPDVMLAHGHARGACRDFFIVPLHTLQAILAACVARCHSVPHAGGTVYIYRPASRAEAHGGFINVLASGRASSSVSLVPVVDDDPIEDAASSPADVAPPVRLSARAAAHNDAAKQELQRRLQESSVELAAERAQLLRLESELASALELLDRLEVTEDRNASLSCDLAAASERLARAAAAEAASQQEWLRRREEALVDLAAVQAQVLRLESELASALDSTRELAALRAQHSMTIQAAEAAQQKLLARLQQSESGRASLLTDLAAWRESAGAAAAADDAAQKELQRRLEKCSDELAAEQALVLRLESELAKQQLLERLRVSEARNALLLSGLAWVSERLGSAPSADDAAQLDAAAVVEEAAEASEHAPATASPVAVVQPGALESEAVTDDSEYSDESAEEEPAAANDVAEEEPAAANDIVEDVDEDYDEEEESEEDGSPPTQRDSAASSSPHGTDEAAVSIEPDHEERAAALAPPFLQQCVVDGRRDQGQHDGTVQSVPGTACKRGPGTPPVEGKRARSQE